MEQTSQNSESTTNGLADKKSKFVRDNKKKLKEKIEALDHEGYNEFIEEAKKLKSDFFIAGSDKDSMIKVNDWIVMPKAIQELTCIPGLPCGLITMAHGDSDAGKSTFCNEALASTQKDDGIAILFLSELKFNNQRAAAMGIKVDGGPGSLIKYYPKTIEQVGDYIFDVARIIDKAKTKKKVCIVWDSIGSTPCENELNVARSNFSMDAAKAITGVLRKTQALIRDKSIAFVMINQIYDKTGITFGKKTTTKGGKAPRYYNALNLEFTKIGRIRPPGVKAPEPFCGIKTKISVEKNHLGQPFREIEADIDWKGFVFNRKPEYAPRGFYDSIAKVSKKKEE